MLEAIVLCVRKGMNNQLDQPRLLIKRRKLNVRRCLESEEKEAAFHSPG